MAKIENSKEIDCKKYRCFSQRLSHGIQMELGQFPIDKYKHEKTGRIVNVFIMNPKLSEYLKKWSESNPRRKTNE